VATPSELIDGSWYEAQYSTPGSRYRGIYDKPNPDWAVAANQWHVRYCAAMLELRSSSKVLELGCGPGRYLAAWNDAGFDVAGIEISHTAIGMSGRTDIIQGTAADLPFPDQSFDVVFSAAFFEHVPPEITREVVAESARVGRMNAHFVPIDQGFEADDDPSHIHLQSVDAWIAELAEILPGYAVCGLPNPAAPYLPMLFWAHPDEVPWPIRNAALSAER
jgi:SAM-dependent methyltransferase